MINIPHIWFADILTKYFLYDAVNEKSVTL